MTMISESKALFGEWIAAVSSGIDALADRFVKDGWSIKTLHRRIMQSAAYRQSSEPSAERCEVS